MKAKSNVLLIACFTAIFFFVSSVNSAPPVLPVSKPLEIKIPKVKESVLSCGMKVLFLKDIELPLVTGAFYAKGGYVLDPSGKEGLISIMLDLMRSGGAGELSPEEFDKALDSRAISMNSYADKEYFAASFNCMSEDLSDVLKYFSDMLRNPKFDPQRFDSARVRILDMLERMRDTPDSITQVLFNRGLYYKHAYGVWANTASTSNVKRENIINFHRENYGPDGAVIALAGKFDEEQVLAGLENLFSDWSAKKHNEVYTEPKVDKTRILFYPKNAPQVSIRIGYIGLKRMDSDYFPMIIGNDILGGSGFTSRLMSKIRSDRGLAYYIYSSFQPWNIKGPFQIHGGTSPDSVKEFIQLCFQIIDEFTAKGPTAQELNEAKQAIIEQFGQNFESSHSQISYIGSLSFNGYPSDFLETYRDKIKAVTAEQIKNAMRKILKDKNYVIVVSGPESLEEILSSFGTVEKIKDLLGPF